MVDLPVPYPPTWRRLALPPPSSIAHLPRSQNQPHTPPPTPSPPNHLLILRRPHTLLSYAHLSLLLLSFISLISSSSSSSSSTAMASSPPSSPLSDPPHGVPLALPAPPSRRLPPPCWSHDETVALIDSYRDKWYSLRRGNLKATHWQDVADAVSRRCPAASPPKTAVQCRHKMEKLRKRYRTEIQRAKSMPLSRFTSSWVHFKRMDAMEKGPAASDSPGDDGEDEEEDQDEELRYGSNMKSMSKMYRNGVGVAASSGFRIRIPTGVSIARPGNKVYPKMDAKFGMNSQQGLHSGPSYATAKVMREYNNNTNSGGRSGVLGERERERDPVAEMVSAIKVLGDGFVRMEQMKMEMAREIETMRMEMEMKRTEMILESQQRIVDAFAKAVSEKKKKAKRMPSPEA